MICQGPGFEVWIIFHLNSESIFYYFPESGVANTKLEVSLSLTLLRPTLFSLPFSPLSWPQTWMLGSGISPHPHLLLFQARVTILGSPPGQLQAVFGQ